MEAFHRIMFQMEPFQLTVRQRLQHPFFTFQPHGDCNGPELEVSLFNRAGEDIITKLNQHPALKKYLPRDSCVQNMLTEVVDSPILSLPAMPIHLPQIVPPPLPLEGEQRHE